MLNCMLTSVILQSADDLLPLDTFVSSSITGLTHGEVDRNLTISVVQEAGTLRIIWKEEPCNHCENTCRDALDDE